MYARAKKGILLDRDGVIIKNRSNYVRNVAQVELLPGVQEAIAQLWEKEYHICIVTNQAGVSKGLYTEQDVKNIHQHIEDLLKQHAYGTMSWYFCPHQDADNCECRKPKPGLLQQAITDHGFFAEDTWLVGDNIRDIEAGRKVNCQTCLVLTGLGKNFCGPEMSLVPQKVCCDLYQFVKQLLLEEEMLQG